MEEFIQEAARVAGFVAAATWRILPVFLLSVCLGILVRALKLDGAIRRAFDARIGVSIVLATVVGAFSPFCSCTVVPLVAGLLISGVPLAPVMSFWIASPTMDPEVFALSVGMLGWPLAVARLVATLLLSFGAGYLTFALARSGLLGGKALRSGVIERYGAVEKDVDECCGAAAVPEPTFVSVGRRPVPIAEPVVGASGAPETAACGGHGFDGRGVAPKRTGRWWGQIIQSLRGLDLRRFVKDVFSQSWALGRWLLLAFAVEALIVFYVPQEAVAGVLGGSNPLAVPLAALVGVPLYMQNVGALPIVSGLLEQGMRPGAAIAFLIGGSVTTVPAMAAVWGVVRPRVFVLYVAVGLAGSVLMGLLTDLFLKNF